MSSYSLVLTTTANLRQARKIANVLLDLKLAACVNITPKSESHYCWKGRLERSAEHLLFIKTRKALYPQLEKVLKEIHPYDVPEIIALPVTAGSRDYLGWILKETKSS